MERIIPVGPWLDRATAYAFGGNVIRTAARTEGEILGEWAAVQRSDGLWQVEGYCYAPGTDFSEEGTYVRVSAT